MEVEKYRWMSINLFYRDGLISLMWTAPVVLPWRHFDLKKLWKRQTAFTVCKNALLESNCVNMLLGQRDNVRWIVCNKCLCNTQPPVLLKLAFYL